MSELIVRINTPAAGDAVPRTFEVTGVLSVQLSAGRGPVLQKSVQVQFGAGGPIQTATFSTATTWRCVGQPNANVPPGATIDIMVTATASVKFFHNPAEPDIEDLAGSTDRLVRIANPPPQLNIDPFAPEAIAAQLPLAFTLSGATLDPDANVASVQCALDLGPFGPVEQLAGDWSRWRKTFNLTAGLHRFIVQVRDLGGNLVQDERFLNVRPSVVTPDSRAASITSWTRLEPHCRNAEIGASINARLFDPMWLMARQWQIGEFQAADAGSPVQARVRATSAMLSRCHLGELPDNTNAQAPRYDPSRMPLEAMVERRRMRPIDANDPSMLSFSVEAGLHFLRMLESRSTTKNYRAAFILKYALKPLATQQFDAVDDVTRRFAQSMAGRALDARQLAVALRANSGVDRELQDPALQISAADRDKVRQAALDWLSWYDGLFIEPVEPSDEAWSPSRLEYAVTVSGSFSDQQLDQINLAASAFDGARLDWSSFDCDFGVNMVSNNDRTYKAVTATAIPAPVSFRGAPAVRYWELEDSRLAYGLLPVGQADLAQLMMIEYMSSYGNDWFVTPLNLPLGSINRVESLVVTDSFGVRTLLKPIGGRNMPARHFSMWQHAYLRRPGAEAIRGASTNLFFLPPAIGKLMESAALEDVLLMRDEMANVAWAIERSIENGTEQASIFSTPAPAQEDVATTAGAPPRYLLSSTVPANWIPLIPVRFTPNHGPDQGKTMLRLKRGAVLQSDGKPTVHNARGQTLNVGAELMLYDAAVPREGIQVTRTRRLSRWIDGSICLWTAFRKQVGRGEGSSGLQFDQLLKRENGR